MTETRDDEVLTAAEVRERLHISKRQWSRVAPTLPVSYALGKQTPRYVYGEVSRISPEAPVPVLKTARTVAMPGGVGNVARNVAGVACFHGNAQIDAFLRATDILVCLLPLTPDTHGILNRDVFAKLHRDSPLGAPVLINAGRGALQNEADTLACLDDGTLGATSLDVFVQEPLPAESPFWTHPKVVLTPHNAADTDADAISAYVAEQIARFEAGGALENVVDRGRGY